MRGSPGTWLGVPESALGISPVPGVLASRFSNRQRDGESFGAPEVQSEEGEERRG